MGGEVKSMRALILAIGALVIVAACGRVPGSQVSPGDYKLYVAASTTASTELSVIDSRSHSVELKMPLGTPSPDWTHLYTVKDDTLLDLYPQSGATRKSVRLPGSNFQLPPATLSGVPGGLSQNGRWLVVESFDRTETIPSATHMLVVDTSYASAPRKIDLNGLFNFDAVNNDGQRVYMIQYLSGNQYHVRFYDLSLGRLDPQIVFDKSDGSAAMAGLRLSGVASPDGHWLYSMYIRENQSPFIHALSLDQPIAFCIDLPGSGFSTNGDQFRWSLALDAHGSHLYAANGATGIVADMSIDNGVPNHPRAVQLAVGQSATSLIQNVEAKELGGNAAALTPDGQTLVIAGKTGLVWVDTASLKARDRQLTGWDIWSVAMTPDGATLYAMDDTGMIAELPVKGSRAANTFSGAAGQPLALIRVAAALP
jgi:hypothetical protein